jgi:hypothetical protein
MPSSYVGRGSVRIPDAMSISMTTSGVLTVETDQVEHNVRPEGCSPSGTAACPRSARCGVSFGRMTFGAMAEADLAGAEHLVVRRRHSPRRIIWCRDNGVMTVGTIRRATTG